MTPRQQGEQAWRQFRMSVSFRQFDKGTPAEIVMKLFLPPESEDLMQVSRPLSKDRREWIKGYEEARAREEIE